MKHQHYLKKSEAFRFFAWLQIILQVIFPLISLIPHNALAQSQTSTNYSQSPFSTDRKLEPTKDTTTLPYASAMSSVANSLSSNGTDGVAGTASSAAAGYASSSAQQWLSQFGTARVQLNVDDNGNWDDSAIDFLAPLYDNKKSMLFTQLGMRAPDGRVTGNLGMGVRTFYLENWMFGGNVFFDDDFTGKNRRIGMGAEAWTNNLKLSANTYVGTTDWHSSRDFNDYYEKPADGYDVRAEGYLPAYPQLGAKLMYEQYYGDNVALFDKDHLQSDPSAVTVGLNYTPVPLITAAVDYKRGQDSMDETKFGINFRYTIGQPWAEQISPSQVAIQRSLAGSRYDLVERNNEIVLQYKKKDVGNALSDMTLVSVKDNSPADGTTANTVTAQAMASDGTPMKNTTISWSVTGGAKLGTLSSVTDNNGNASVYVTNTTAEQVVVTATSGSISRSTPSNFTKSVAKLDLKLTKNNSQSDGTDQNAGQVTVQDANGKAMPSIAITWAVDNGAAIASRDSVTDSNGIATVHFTNSKPGTVKLTASTSGKTESVNSNFGAETVSKIDVSMKTNNALSDGSSTNIVQAVVTNTNGHAMQGVSLTWSLGSGNASATSPLTVATDNNGIATLNLVDSKAESVVITANAGGQTGKATAIFTSIPVNKIAVTMTTNNSPANGRTENTAQATVTDANGQPMKGINLSWSLGQGKAKATTSLTVITDDNGNATLNLVDSTAETVSLTASAGGKIGQADAIFAAVPVDTITVTMSNNHSPADGSTANVAQALVEDAEGHAMQGVSLTWRLDNGSATTTTPLTVTTDANGVATLSLTDSTAESVTVIADAGGKTGQTTAIFDTVQTTLTVTMQTDKSDSDGSAKNIAQVLVMQGNTPVSGASVQWSKTSTNAKYASASSTYTNGSGVATLSMTDLTAETFTVTATVNGQSASTQTTFVSPNFGPIQVSFPEAASTPSGTAINVDVALGGTPVLIAAYNGMSAGDVIVITSNVSGDKNGQTLDYTSPTYTVQTSDVGHDVSIDIPEDKLMGVEADVGGAKLNVVASVTKGQATIDGKTSISIDTCGPGGC